MTLISCSSDVERVLAGCSSVCLFRGGYWEPSVTRSNKKDIDRCFGRHIHLLLASDVTGAAIATHDEIFVAKATALAGERGINPAQFEFQMLTGCALTSSSNWCGTVRWFAVCAIRRGLVPVPPR